MFLFPGRKSKIFLAVLIMNGAFLFLVGSKTAQAYHATSSYDKLFTDTLTSQNWNDLFSDFVNTWLPVSLNGPVGIATSSPVSGLEVNGDIRGGSIFSSGNVGFGTSTPLARLEVVPASGYSILAGNFKIGNVALPTADSDAATKGYVDSFVASATSSLEAFWGGSIGSNIWSLNSGLVGIGTASPTDKLTVYEGRINIRDVTPTDFSVLEFGNNMTALGGGFFLAGSTATGYGGPNSMNLVNLTSGPVALGTNNKIDVTLISNGNLGIGTSTPTQKLELGSGNILFDDINAKIYFGTGLANYITYVGWTVGGYQDIVLNQARTGSPMGILFRTNNTDRMKITSDGKVGIGTTSPVASLEIIPASGYSILAGNFKIGNVALPTVDSDAATKGYVDSFVASYVASGVVSSALYVGITPTAYTGDNNGSAGYTTAQNACKAAYASSSVCTPDNILGSISAGITLAAEDVWIFAGPPGYTAAANDCEGRSVATTAAYGTYWQIAMPGSGRPQGRGLLMKCNNALRIACCR